jgi:translocation and assembly module TamB
LRGTAQRSLLTGSASILRSSFSPNLDFASILSRPAQPLAPPASPNELLSGMQLDLSVTTAPNARFENSLARNLQAEADLRIQGTPYKPVLLGRISVNQGEINFLGNRYRISRGDITFANPFRIEPLLDLDLNTRVRGVEVTMNFTGPADKLNLTYRSDPPLQVNEIIALLAVGRAPSEDPAVLTRQTQADQSWQQVSANTLVGAAFETLEGGRLQRFFGVSRIKIDPKLTGLGNVPEAQLTLEQQVSRDITFTYVTNLAQEQQQLVRVEWNVSRQWSVLAVRDENGLFGIEVQFRRQFK